MKRKINKVAVIGSGVMGSQIACHFANIGVEVLLLDIVPNELTDKEKKKGLTLEDKAVRNRIVDGDLAKALKMKPSPIYSKSFADRISTGNLEDDLSKISEVDWIIEVVIERLDIKKSVFENIEKHRKEGTLISSNTSGIPIHLMLDGRSDDFKKHFAGTHFFNPPRYLQLLEVIPTEETAPEVVDFYMEYGRKFLGKKTVLCKDTPAFIANRIGVYSIMSLFNNIKEMDLTIEEIDRLTGTIMGRQKSATFRTADVVGLDTLVLVANGLKDNCPDDEEHDMFALPDYIQKMVDNKWLGAKSGQGFYKKVKEDGKSVILSLDLNTLEYTPQKKVKFPTLDLARAVDDLTKRTQMLVAGQDKAGEFYRTMFGGLFAYATNRIPEIADDLHKIDDAIKAGFGWALGPFETWDILGFEKGLELIEKDGKKAADWIHEMKKDGVTKFYKKENGQKLYYDYKNKAYKVIPGTEDLVILDTLRDDNTVWKNSDVTIVDLGDGILNLEFHTKQNTIGTGVVEGINKAIDLAETEYKGLVVYNEGQNFSAGANVGLIFMMAAEQDYDELNFAVKAFQDTSMRIRYSSAPIVIAPHNMALGGGCEFAMHSDKVVTHAETYMGLVEFGVGLIPGGGGTKEFAKRYAASLEEGDIRINRLQNRFLTIGQAKVSTSAEEAFELGYLRRGQDEVVVSREYQLTRAKEACLALANAGYTAPAKEKITIEGKQGLGIVYVGADSMKSSNYISEHDKLISEKLGYVMCGGDMSERLQVSEQYLLDLERKAFLELCGERKTLERIQSLIQTGKILRN